MKHTKAAIELIKHKLTDAEQLDIAHAMYLDMQDELETLRQKTDNTIAASESLIPPMPRNPKTIWNNVSVKCESEEQQIHLMEIAYLCGIHPAKTFRPRMYKKYPCFSVARQGKSNNFPITLEHHKEYTYSDFIAYYTENQCKGQ